MLFENSERMLVVDPLHEKGHKKFNALFLEKIQINSQIFVPSKAVAKRLSVKRQMRFLYTFQQIVYLLYILFYSVKTSRKEILFLSYELVSMASVSHLFTVFNKKIYLVEHNTLVPAVKLKFKLFKFISKSATHIGLENFIADFIKKKN